MTLRAILREAARHVIRIGRLLEVWQVTARARCCRSGVLAVDVATGALDARMLAVQRKTA